MRSAKNTGLPHLRQGSRLGTPTKPVAEFAIWDERGWVRMVGNLHEDDEEEYMLGNFEHAYIRYNLSDDYYVARHSVAELASEQ